jgi:hypothetical protein
MTICIAAQSEGIIFLASDRMLTAGDIEFEPPAQKVLFLTSSMVVMFSGDASFHSEVLLDVNREVQQRVQNAPDEWLLVRDVAGLYIKYRNQAKLRRAEAALLAPLGLDKDSFLQMQRSMDSGLVDKLASEIVNFKVPDVDVIIAGIELRLNRLAFPSMYTIYDARRCCIRRDR